MPARASIEIRIASDLADLPRVLAEEPELQQVQLDGRLIVASAPADAQAQAALLKRLIERGVPVHGFAPRARNLEDLFLHVTEGKVQ
jgi:hypothetical protein